MPFRRIVSVLLLFAATPAVSKDEADPITDASFRAHVEFLASDRLEGRETGSRGHEIAEYVASRFQAIGLQPANGKDWYQRVPLASADIDLAASKLSIAGRTFENRKEVHFGPGRTAGRDTLAADVVFAGFGIDDPKAGLDDYRGLDVKGKIVAVLHGFPKGMPSDVGAHYGRTKQQMASARGAIGIITIRTLERERTRPWSREMEGPFRPTIGWTNPDGRLFTDAPNIQFSATLHDKAAEALFAGAPASLQSVLAAADRKGGRPKGFALKQRVALDRVTLKTPLTSPNVVAMLPGSDPALANEYVLLMGHLDHIGVDPKREGDTIFNGAMDNASGIAAMLEAARALAASPARPKRSILFAAVTGEEHGLVGADYLARHPLVSGGKVVAVVNLDMPVLLYDFQDVIAFGAEHSTMGGAVARAGQGLGVALTPDPLPAEGLFTRSDHYMFVKQGVPSIFLMTGFAAGGDKAFQDFLKTHYHRPSDQSSLPGFDWKAGAKFARINMRIASEIANAEAAPQWYGDSFFGSVFAPTQAKASRK
jgi:hypothetical protein